MNTILLAGVQPEPLSGYLKGLGILRLVSLQVDKSARGHWSSEGFVLTSTLSEDDLRAFFLLTYRPTPIVSPWNGGSGFGEKDNTEALDLIRSSLDPRFATYRQVIDAVIPLGRLDDSIEKSDYLQHARNVLPDAALDWLDAAAVIFSGGVRYPILLGTGGNDGRLDFSNNFMQRLIDALEVRPPKKALVGRAADWLTHAMFGDGVAPLVDAAIGQFDPGSAGGSNSAPQGKGKSLVNPWDFVLMIEGSIVFSGAAVRRQGESSATMSVPFTFTPSSAGYASATPENGRGEIWAPLWSEPATFAGVRNLFAEGRVTWNGRNARTGLDAVRAISTLQHDRRIESFARFAITERFGLSNVAVPVGRISTPHNEREEVAVTAGLDRWLKSIRDIGERFIPSSISAGLRRVDGALFSLAQCQRRDSCAELLLDVLYEVAVLEMMCSRSTGVRGKVRPIRSILAVDWLRALQPVFTESVEARIAWALASGRGSAKTEPQSLRELLTPVSRDGKWTATVIVDGLLSAPIESVLANAAARREWVTSSAGSSDEQARKGSRIAFTYGGRIRAADAVTLAHGRVERERLRRCLQAFLLLHFTDDVNGLVTNAPEVRLKLTMPSVIAATLSHAGTSDRVVPSPTGLVRQLCASSHAAIKTLRRSVQIEGFEPMIDDHQLVTPWMAAALLVSPVRSDLAGSFLSRSGYQEATSQQDAESTAVNSTQPKDS
jgi:CRISPR-associated protein Csx17